MAGEEATFTDPQLAGRRWVRCWTLGDAGAGLDEAREPEQLAPFAEEARGCRPVTTRAPESVAGRCVAVKVDDVAEQARALFTTGFAARSGGGEGLLP